jgi:hypothetical protein
MFGSIHAKPDNKMVIMDNGENMFINAQCYRTKFGFKTQSEMYQRHGGLLEIPVSDSCLLDKECRRDMLTIASNAIKNGVGSTTLWWRQSEEDTANRDGHAVQTHNIQKKQSFMKTYEKLIVGERISMVL